MEHQKIINLAQPIWNYMKKDDKITNADLILGPGTVDLLPVETAVELYVKGLAPL